MKVVPAEKEADEEDDEDDELWPGVEFPPSPPPQAPRHAMAAMSIMQPTFCAFDKFTIPMPAQFLIAKNNLRLFEAMLLSLTCQYLAKICDFFYDGYVAEALLQKNV
ncbi:hypothetical protein [Asticcacaulis sp. 201]|uniref:hypothetical protein n=1 Tax=Asticcacaulis sp. 201 TaxID=3028787 RepID=UPI002916BFCD|nr:hypothetical protein [Asticcacaulis sp. 201]MDV6332472.1 hypothetical protein [Asticcacaulis sp. 201]